MQELWASFWNPPEGVCPKCGGAKLAWYDPFFFNPVRTLSGRRRIRCGTCRFVWRRSRGDAPSAFSGLK